MEQEATPTADDLADLPLADRAKRLTEVVADLERRLEETAESEPLGNSEPDRD